MSSPNNSGSSIEENSYGSKGEEEEETQTVQVINLLVLLARGRDILIAIIAIFLAFGTIYGIVSSPEYKASARTVPESTGKGARGLGGLGGGSLSALQGFGVNLGSLGQDGLSKEAYPEILKSREVRLSVVRDTFRIPETDTTATIVEYFNSRSGFIAWVSSLLRSFAPGLGTQASAQETREEYPSFEEEQAIQRINGMVTSVQNPQNGLMKISVTAGDPRLATEMVNSFLSHLSSRVRTVRTRKARENLNFIQKRFEEAKEQLSEAERQLADFVDRNQNINTAELRTKRDRLERQVRFKSSLYSELQGQLTKAELDLKRSEPVLTMVEKPVPPMEPIAPQWLLIIVLSLMTGTATGVGVVLIRAYFSEENSTGERRAKIQEIRDAFYPKRVVSVVGDRLTSLVPRSNSDIERSIKSEEARKE
jgi:uncharacterized protein involved in exopolysaccharide biosynthesis